MDSFPDNLRLLCSYRPSISAVGRDLSLNRSQLNRYLSGASYPRPALLRRICDYFGVEPHEIVLPAEEFARIVRLKGVSSDGLSQALRGHFDRIMARNDPRVFQLVGTFFEYYYSMSTPGKIIRSLVAFDSQDDHLFYRRLERIGPHDRPCQRHFRYQGVASMMGDRVFMNDYEYAAGLEVTQTVLYPDYYYRWTTLYGVKVGVSATRLHVPCCVRVYVERTPPRTRMISNLRACGLFDPDDPAIPRYVLPLICNRQSGTFSFPAHGAAGPDGLERSGGRA